MTMKNRPTTVPVMKGRFERFFIKCDGCWNWHGTLSPKNYGVFYLSKSKRIAAHRAAWEFYKGKIFGELQVLHKCDNRRCVNPNHLFLGTNSDNVADKVAKGRCASLSGSENPMYKNYASAARGDRVSGSKLNDSAVISIRQEYKNGGTSQNILARKYKVSQSCIWGILNRKTWTHI